VAIVLVPSVIVSVVVPPLYEILICRKPLQIAVLVTNVQLQSDTRAIGLNDPAIPPQFEHVPFDGAVIPRV
jgi:hypothetical protein